MDDGKHKMYDAKSVEDNKEIDLVNQSHHDDVKIIIDEEYPCLRRIGEFLHFIGF